MTDPNGGGGGDDFAGLGGMGGEFSPDEVVKSSFGSEYTIVSVLGRGSHATAYSALNHLGQPRVLKVIHSHLLKSERLMNGFQQEAMALGKLNHPNVVRVYTAGVLAGPRPRPFIEMELLTGYEGRRLVERGPLEIPNAIETLIDIGRGLDAVHKAGFIHQDLKLDNIFCHWNESQRKWVVKLLDFGVARIIGQAAAHGVVFSGTIEYAAPEQLSGNPDDVTPKSDLWAFGVIAFELFTGERPHREAEEQDRLREATAGPFDENSDDPQTLNVVIAKREEPARLMSDVVAIPKRIDVLVAAILEIEPAKRPADAATITSELEAIKALLPKNSTRATTQEVMESTATQKPSSKPTMAPRRRTLVAMEGPRGTVIIAQKPRETVLTAPMQESRPLATEPAHAQKRPSHPPNDRVSAHAGTPAPGEAVSQSHRPTVRGLAPAPEPASARARPHAEPDTAQANEDQADPRRSQSARRMPNSQLMPTRVVQRAPSVPPSNVASLPVRPTVMGMSSPPAPESYVEPDPARAERRVETHRSRSPNSHDLLARSLESESFAPSADDDDVVLPSEQAARRRGNLLAVGVFLAVVVPGAVISWIVVNRDLASATKAVTAAPDAAIPIVIAQVPPAQPLDVAPLPTSSATQAPLQEAPTPSPAPAAVTVAPSARPPRPPTPPTQAKAAKPRLAGVPDLAEDDIGIYVPDSYLAPKTKPATKPPAAAKPSIDTEDPINWIIRIDAGRSTNGAGSR